MLEVSNESKHIDTTRTQASDIVLEQDIEIPLTDSDEDTQKQHDSVNPAQQDDGNRVFKLNRLNGQEINSEHCYHGKRPNAVAIKAFNWYCRRNGKQEFECSFTIQDQTTNKNYEYQGSRKRLETPKIINRLGVEYSVNYETIVRRN